MADPVSKKSKTTHSAAPVWFMDNIGPPEADRAHKEIEKKPTPYNSEITIDDINRSRDLDDESQLVLYKRLRALKAEAQRQVKEEEARLGTARRERKLRKRVATAAHGPLRDEMSAQYLARPIAGVTNIEDAQEMIDQLNEMFREVTGLAGMVRQQTERLARWVQYK
ncbi:hypothetical protein H2202_007584 [Exophiala xenobiotica]|nr:hypothetical protein H2202_007584 [Exophiala xenobiotica]KAK5236410.1 hypothetical protein LTR47_002361 [Exophiala xenobiotica]KAK5242457.1 hypothetical protein LTS06_011507 [Exophiala xenobiotica]KAK5280431.1 hypothetical protein LTR40_006361 [Exophiala xenobiotica]KAK5323186.1 hypothetical protein LTR93_005239 [Exophiala xenobiotica]